MHATIDVLAAAGVDVKFAAHAIDSPLQQPVLNFRAKVHSRLLEVEITRHQTAEVRCVRDAAAAAAKR